MRRLQLFTLSCSVLLCIASLQNAAIADDLSRSFANASQVIPFDPPLEAPGLPHHLALAAFLSPLAEYLTRTARLKAARMRFRRRKKVEEVGLRALIAALNARDHYTGDHSEAVVQLAGKVARRLHLSDQLVDEVEQVALLHDIGKIGIPDSILNKQGPLDDEEWVLMRQHPAIGARIAASVESLSHLSKALRSEHERWDGKGYPDGLSGREIPLASRIILVCDAYHAMVSTRSYRKSMSLPEALDELEKNAGTQFCPDTVQALLEVLDEAAKVLSLGRSPAKINQPLQFE